MKITKTYFKTLLLAIVMWLAFDQNISAQTSMDSTLKNLIGTWYLHHRLPYTADTLDFTRTTGAPHNFGSRIEIMQDQEFRDIYTAPCGNDDKIHSTTGKWFFDITTMTFETTIPIDFKNKKYKIIFLDAARLVLAKTF